MKPFYEDYAVTIYHADAREIYKDIGIYQHAFFDPPYDKQTHDGARSNAADYEIKFAPIDSPETVVKLATPTRWTLSFCSVEMLGDYRRATGERWTRSGIWDRIGGTPQITGDRPAQAVEGIAIWHSDSERRRWNGGGKHAIWRHKIVSGNSDDRVHETQKPLSLMRELVLDFTDPDELIVDLFAGSGTTGVAAKLCGRRAILVELDEQRCAVAAKRIAETSLDERISRVRAVRAKQGALDWLATEAS